MITAGEIKYFVEVATISNVTRAAQKLGISQPTLSYSLKKIEGELGVKLFNRTKSGVALTKVGERVFHAANQLTACWEQIFVAAKNTSTEIRGRFTLGCHVSVALYSLPHFLMELVTEYPGIEISIIHSGSRDITSQVIDRKIDFGIVINPIHHPDLIITELGKDKVTFWQSKNIKNHDILICDTSINQTQILLRDFKEEKRFSRIITSGSLEVIAMLTAQGCGVGVLPERVVGTLNDQRITRVPKAPLYHDILCLIRRADQMTTTAHKIITKKIKEAGI